MVHTPFAYKKLLLVLILNLSNQAQATKTIQAKSTTLKHPSCAKYIMPSRHVDIHTFNSSDCSHPTPFFMSQSLATKIQQWPAPRSSLPSLLSSLQWHRSRCQRKRLLVSPTTMMEPTAQLKAPANAKLTNVRPNLNLLVDKNLQVQRNFPTETNTIDPFSVFFCLHAL